MNKCTSILKDNTIQSIQNNCDCFGYGEKYQIDYRKKNGRVKKKSIRRASVKKPFPTSPIDPLVLVINEEH